MTVGPVSDGEGYLDRWSGLHGGYDPRSNRLVVAWLRIAYAAARPLARLGVPPDVVSFMAVAVSACALGAASAGGRWALVAAVLVVAAGLLDNLDGAVALIRGRVTRFGMVLDSSCDRISDVLFVTSLWALGAPGRLCVVGGLLMFLQEYVRAYARVAGMPEIGVVTLWERPTRVIVTAAFTAAVGVLLDSRWATLGAAAWVGLGALGLVQLAIVVRRRLG